MDKVFKPIIGPIIEIGKFFKEASKIIAKIILMFPKIFSLFEMFTDPTKFIKDILWGIIEGVKAIYNALLGQLMGKVTNLEFATGKSRVQTCFDPSMTNIILLVLCPSLSLTLHIGLKQFHLILICALLSYFYYFPGLIYASLFIL